ncbi:MAG: hypothetical protein FVQ82_15205 [Planctomycetes bacterium]|nr:hypothetical protein [Planctomycetota bacterium]
METKRIITVFITVLVFAGLIICPALARRYDTMMVRCDRWIDIGIKESEFEQAEDGDDEEPNVITYDGELEPNTITLIYYPDEHPEHPNDINTEDEHEPNLVVLFRQPDTGFEHPNSIDYEEDIEPNRVLFYAWAEHPEHPNSIDYEEDIEPNQVLIYVRGKHPEEPNDISAGQEIDPNDTEKIILDEGTANLKRKNPNIAKSS